MSHVTYAVTEMSQIASVGEMQLMRLPIPQEINIMMFQKRTIYYAAKSIKKIGIFGPSPNGSAKVEHWS